MNIPLICVIRVPKTAGTLDKNKKQLASLVIEHTGILKKTEQFALVFCSAWISNANSNTKKAEDLLIA